MDLNGFRKKLKKNGYKNKAGALRAAGKVEGKNGEKVAARKSALKKYGDA